jgi:hypothetical protein
MNEKIQDFLSEWFDSDAEVPVGESDVSANEAREAVAQSLLIHGLLSDIGSRNDDAETDRIRAVMQRIDAESESESAPMINAAPNEAQRRRWSAMLTSALTIAAALMVMFFVFGPHQSVSAAMASLEKVVEAAAKPFDRTYSVRVVEEYPRDKRPRNLSQEAWDREAEEQIDGVTLYVRGANQYLMTVMLNTGEKRTSGCDGQQCWAFRENGPVHTSTDLNRFRGGLPGQRQDIPFLNIHAHLSQLRTGYEIELGDEHENAGNGAALSKLIGVRKSRDVRGPKQVEIWFDADNGTVHKMLLDGLPRGGGGPKSLMLELIDQSELDSQFFFHESHHEIGRRVISE